MAKCKQCGRDIFLDYTNPNVHYGMPPKLCSNCEYINNAKVGDWLQDSKGNYYQKEA